MHKIILVEDDEKLSSLIKKYLQQHQFEVEVVHDGGIAVDAIVAAQADVVILDLMLPNKDGLTICREIRPLYQGIILFLTASEDDMDHVAGAELGADDFIVKPIQPRVLLARIRMALRRTAPALGSADPYLPDMASAVNDTAQISSTTKAANSQSKQVQQLSYGDLSIFYYKRAVTLANKSISLTTGELELLWLLANHAEEVLSRDYIYKTLRGIEYDGLDRAIDTTIANLRKKLGDNAALSTRIITVRGQGYLFVPDSWNESANNKGG